MSSIRLAAAALAALIAAPLAAAPPAARDAAAPAVKPAANPAESGRALRAQERERRNIYKAWFPDRETARRAAVTLHHALLESDYARGWQIFELEDDEIALLQRFGYKLEPATEFIARRDAFLDAIDRSEAAGNGPGAFSIPGYTCYQTVEETQAEMQQMAASRPTLASIVDIGDSWQKTTGSGGYDLLVLKLTNSAIPGPKPIFLVASAIHAREYATAPIAMELARWLFNGYGSDPDATWILDHEEVHLLIQNNPDGRKKAETGLSWRKNTNTAYCGATSNSRGVDLNRNFSFSWNSTNGQGSSGSQCNETYRGPSAHSEPETQALENYIRAIWPDRRGPGLNDPAPDDTSGLHIDLHSYADLVLWPWGEISQPAPNSTALRTLGRRLAYFNGYEPTQSIGLYPTDGTSDGPSYGELGVPNYTIELGSSFFQSCSSYTSTVLPANLPALKYGAKVARAPYLLPAGPEVLSVAVTVPTLTTPLSSPTVSVSATLNSARFNQTNGTEPVLPIAQALAYIDTPPWVSGAHPVTLTAADGAFNSSSETAVGRLSIVNLVPGRHMVFVQGVSSAGQAGPVTAQFFTVDGPIKLFLSVQSTGPGTGDVTVGWHNARHDTVEVWRNGELAATVPNTGSWVDSRPSGTWTYRVCEPGSTLGCSVEQSISF